MIDGSVSVVIPVRNGEDYLRQAISSVLGQTVAPAEVVVVDDGSTDASAAIAGEFTNVRVLRIMHSGVSVARNTGVAGTAGEFVAFLDADDYWSPAKLERQRALALAHPATGIVMARQGYVFEGPVPAWFRGPIDGSSEAGYQPSNWFVRRSTWELVGEFRPELTHSEDTDWLARASDMGVRTAMVDEMLVTHRIHGRNASAAAADVRVNVLRTLRDSVHRKRELRT